MVVVALACAGVIALLSSGSRVGQGPRQVSASVGQATAACRPGESVVPIGHGGARGAQRVDAVVLACARSDRVGTVRLSGYRSKAQVCLAIEYPRSGESHTGGCIAPDGTFGSFCASRRGCTLGATFIHGYSELSGPMADEGRAIRVTKRGEAIPGAAFAVAHVSGVMLRRLGIKAPFSYFLVVAPGCVSQNAVRIEVLDGQGNVIGDIEGVPAEIAIPCQGRQ